MEEIGEVKHVVLVKFKDEVSEEQIEQLVKDFANLVDLIEPMKSFKWGKDLSNENMHQGFTHIFESTFLSTEGIAEYLAHPAHVDYGNRMFAQLDKFIVFDYKPTSVRL